MIEISHRENAADIFCFYVVKVYLTENAASKEARVNELETELARSQASSTRICQVG